MRKLKIPVTILNVLALIFLFFLYGPVPYFRNLLVTTSLETMRFGYIAKIFYSDKTIDKIKNENNMKEIEEDTDKTEVNIGEEIELTKYDKEILDREEGQVYKIIELSNDKYKGYMAVVYDPSRVTLGMTNNLGKGGQFIKTIANNEKALIAMNASGFDNVDNVITGGYPTGTIIRNGSIIWEGPTTGWPGGLVGFSSDNILTLTKKTGSEAVKNGMKNAVEFGPFLIVNGKKAEITGNGGYGLAPRTAIGQRKDGIVLLVVIDGRQPGHSLGADMSDLVELFEKYGAHNASNLDGGASSTMWVEGKIMNNQNYDRAAPNAWIVK